MKETKTVYRAPLKESLPVDHVRNMALVLGMQEDYAVSNSEYQRYYDKNFTMECYVENLSGEDFRVVDVNFEKESENLSDLEGVLQ